MTADPHTVDQCAEAAARACAAALPASQTLSAGEAGPAQPDVATGFAGAVVCEVGGANAGTVAVLVAQELVDALASSPMGGLDLAAAVQPALDAAVGALGGAAQGARGVALEEVVGVVAGADAERLVVVPLHGTEVVGALLVPDSALRRAAAVTGLGSSGAAQATGAEVHSISQGRRGLELLHGVEMEVTVELGRTRMTVRDLLALAPGAVLALDRAAGSPADLLVNGRLIARGEVVVIDEDFGLRLTEILDQSAVGAG